MAGAGAKLFASGDVLTADQVNTYLMDQTIMKFASTSARDAAFGGAGEPTLAEGMFAYTTDTNTLWLYTGATDGWVNVLGSDIGQQALSNRNVVINGAMQIAQRGTSTTGITTGGAYNTADRWLFQPSAMGTWTQTQEADAPTGSGFRNSLKVLCTTADASPAASDFVQFQQTFEGQNLQQFAKGTSSAKSFSLSFWVKSNVTGTYVALLADSDNTRQVGAQYTINASATWEKKTITFPADTTGAFDNDSNGSLILRWYLGAGTDRTSGTLRTSWAATVTADLAVGQTNVASAINNYWQITGVQLEAGAVATPFEFEDYGVTLAKCQRYYYRTGNATFVNLTETAGAFSTTTVYANVPLKTTLRANPSSIDTGGTLKLSDSVTSTTVTAITLDIPNLQRPLLKIDVASGLTQYRPYQLSTTTDGTAYLGISAEL